STDVLPQFSGTGLRCRRMKLYDYIQYIDAAAAASGSQSVSPGTLPDDFHELETRLMYLYWNAFSQHPELLEEVKLSPEFVEDWLPFLPEAFHKVLAGVENYFSSGLLIGPEGSLSRLHFDVLHTHAYLAQIVGRKRCILFSSDDSPALYD